MPLRKLAIKPGINREATRYATEGGWYDSDKVRFRGGFPEKIGGWIRISAASFLGVCRSLWTWTTLSAQKLTGVGTNLKFYIEQGGLYRDVTPLRTYDYSATLTNPFTTAALSPLVTVSHTAHGAQVGDLVTFFNALSTGGISSFDLNRRHTVLAPVTANSYVINVGVDATSSVTGGGTVQAQYIIEAFTLVTDPFSTVLGSTTVDVTDATGGYSDGDFVSFSGATMVGGLTISGEYQITTTDTTTYTIEASSAATSTAVGGGSAVLAKYQISVGPASVLPLTGWGAGGWGSGSWGVGVSTDDSLRIWNQRNWGEDLFFGPRGGGLYYWDASTGTNTRGFAVSSFEGSSGVPLFQNLITISDTSRFAFVFGTNEIGTTSLDPMVIRWSDQEDIGNWSPAITNQAGSLRLSNGSKIIAVQQARQEILVWTDTSVYSLQYLGPPFVWGSQLVGDNISIASQNAVVYANGSAFWMGVDKFYMYNGQVQTLRCDVKRLVFQNINVSQLEQVFCGSNEGFNEVWWFYCSEGSTEVGNYVVFNYSEDIWYYGTMARTAWLDSALKEGPLAATYLNNVVIQEYGVDDLSAAEALPIPSYISSSQFDLEDGHQFMFINRIMPDITFNGSTSDAPSVVMTLLPLKNSGSGYNDPRSVGGTNEGGVTRTAVLPVEQFTEQIFTRIRGRQLALRVESEGTGVTWQLGAPRLDMRPDGRR